MRDWLIARLLDGLALVLVVLDSTVLASVMAVLDRCVDLWEEP